MKEEERNRILEEATSENTTPKRLEELATIDEPKIRQAVAANPNTPRNSLFDLAAEFPQQFLNNCILDLLLLEDSNFLAQLPNQALVKILPLPEVPEYFLQWAIDCDNNIAVLAAINNSSLSLKNLDKIISKYKNKKDKYSDRICRDANLHVNKKSFIDNAKQQQIINDALYIATKNYQRSWILKSLQKLISSTIRDRINIKPLGSYVDNNSPKTNTINKYIIQDQKWRLKTRLETRTQNKNVEALIDLAFAAKSSETPIKILEKLAKDKNKLIRRYVAKNPNLSDSLWQQLAMDKQKSVRACVAKNINAPEDILEILALPKYGVRHEVAKNINTPASVLRKLAKNKHIKVSRRLAQNPNTPSDILQELSQVDDEIVKCKLAINPSTPENILEQLSRTKLKTIKIKLVQNKNITAKALLKIIENGDVRILELISHNPNLSVDALESLVLRCAWLLQNSKYYHDIWVILRHVLNHKNCSFKVQKYILNLLPIKQVNPYHNNLNIAVFTSEYAEPKVLEKYADSIDWLERYAIATNPNTLQTTILKLAQDSNIIVSNSAISSAILTP